MLTTGAPQSYEFARTMQSWLVALLLIAAAAEAASAEGKEPLAPCGAVAVHVRSVAADPEAFGRQHALDYEALLAPIIRLPPPELADADLWAKAIQLLGSDRGQLVEVQHVDGPVWRTYQVAGTAACATETFFSVRSDGVLNAIETPATFGDLCWGSNRQIGSVGGRPALIEQEVREHPLPGLDVEITPWTSGERATCKVAIRFNDAFHVTERFCKDRSLCRAAEPLAPKLAEALARAADGNTLAAVAPPPADTARALAARLLEVKESIESDHLGYTMLPTFGAKPRTEYATYAGNIEVALVDIAGQTLIARVGIGGVGWREIGDYLIALYSDDTQRLDPVASFVVERQTTGLQSVTTSVPQPYVNSR
jgi:hypothetical protein